MIVAILRSLGALILGLIVSFALILCVELFSSVVYPLPADFKGTQEEVCQHVAKYPPWILAVVVVAWSATAAVGTWIAQRLGNAYASSVIGCLLVAGVVMNISMLPYPMWFKIVIVIAVPLAAIAGSMNAIRRVPLATTDQPCVQSSNA